jgi:hypothetical protein
MAKVWYGSYALRWKINGEYQKTAWAVSSDYNVLLKLAQQEFPENQSLGVTGWRIDTLFREDGVDTIVIMAEDES